MSGRSGQKAAHLVLRDVNQALVAELRQLTGADSEPVKAAASVLRKEIRRTLSTPGGNRHMSLKTRRIRGTPSAPGQPPAKQSGRLARAVGSAVVGGVRRVGFSDFRARILEFGAVVTPGAAATSKVSKLHPKRRVKGRRAIVIPPRPFMERSLAAAMPKMVDAAASPLQQLGGAR